jgi:adenylate cyclase
LEANLSGDRIERRLAAILAADVAGYSRLMGADEEGTLAALRSVRRELCDRKIVEHRGRIVKTTGDGLLVEFQSVVDAVRCAVEMQRGMAERNKDVPSGRRIEFRIGINVGDIVVEDGDIFGDGVNIAARLETLADPGGICISARVQEDVAGRLDLMFSDLGDQRLKNIQRPLHAYSITVSGLDASPSTPVDMPPPHELTVASLSVVVLPFVNLSNDPDQEFFADGITDDLTTDLSRISGSLVIARNTAFTFKGKSVDLKQLGHQLGVRYVIEGSVRLTDHRIRVNIQLIDADNGAHLWADRFDTSFGDLAQAQDEITGRLAQSLNLELIEATGRRIERDKPVNPSAQEFIMRGWAWYYRPMSSVATEEGLKAFRRALRIDRRSTDARIGIASLLVRKWTEGWSTSRQEDAAAAEGLLLEALEEAPNRPSAHYAFGMLRRAQNRLEEARVEFETTIALDRNHARAFFRLGQTLLFLCRPEEGIPQLEKSIRLNPLDPNIARPYGILGIAHLLLGHADQGIEFLRRSCTANPRMYWAHLNLAGALSLAGDLDGAKIAFAESLRLKPAVDSFARLHDEFAWAANPQYLTLIEPAIYTGLRRLGFPD